MPYLLAKKLKDAGFTQRLSPEEALAQTSAGVVPAYNPNLSELIEACRSINHDFDIIIEVLRNDRVYAGARLFGFTERNANGETPEEAVANLWLALVAVRHHVALDSSITK
jgi:hypothetical protein